MEAKDTVVHADGCSTNLGIIGANCNCGSEAQAKISFKAGKLEGYETGFDDGQNYSFTANCTVQSIKDEAKKAGLKEAVEWIKKRHHRDTGYECAIYIVDKREWQSKLKEWGL